MLIKALLYNIGGFSVVLLAHGTVPPLGVILGLAALVTYIVVVDPRQGESLWRWPRYGRTNSTRY
jgi:hypothetical protein